MQRSAYTKALLAGAFVAAAGMLPLVASAHTHVWIGANLTGLLDDLIGAPPPAVVYAPQPTYYAAPPPAPVYYAPQPPPPPPGPAYYAPPPPPPVVTYAPAPTYYVQAPAVGLNVYYDSNDWRHWHRGHGRWHR